MSKDTFADIPVLVVPGLHGSGPGHWQSRWLQAHTSWLRVSQDHWSLPDLEAWAGRLHDAIVAASRPVLIAAHSFGCLAAVHAGSRCPQRIAGALLVAPANPEKFGVDRRLPFTPPGFRSRIVASDNDPWMSLDAARLWAGRWGSALTVLRGAGHINAESGLGDWPQGLDLLRRVVPPSVADAPGPRGSGVPGTARAGAFDFKEIWM
ncbi:MAG: alpha/beta hydrolase [Burkholderiales bacterium]|nr:alpha/beta hydrolase [Burkholderiales bacterium]